MICSRAICFRYVDLPLCMENDTFRPWQSDTLRPGRATLVPRISPYSGTGKKGQTVGARLDTLVIAARTQEMFLKILRNIFCVQDTKFVYTINVVRMTKRVTIWEHEHVSNIAATVCPRFAGLVITTATQHGDLSTNHIWSSYDYEVWSIRGILK